MYYIHLKIPLIDRYHFSVEENGSSLIGHTAQLWNNVYWICILSTISRNCTTRLFVWSLFHEEDGLKLGFCYASVFYAINIERISLRKILFSTMLFYTTKKQGNCLNITQLYEFSHHTIHSTIIMVNACIATFSCGSIITSLFIFCF